MNYASLGLSAYCDSYLFGEELLRMIGKKTLRPSEETNYLTSILCQRRSFTINVVVCTEKSRVGKS
jgi:hypothetical protein